jgi:hypothetical protein
VRGWWGDTESVLLYDGAEAVPVVDRDSVSAITTYPGRGGEVWCTYLCCGPAAPYPPAYRETVIHDEGGAWVTYEIEERGQRHVRNYRYRDFSERMAHVSAATVWQYVRDAYAYHIEGREGELL